VADRERQRALAKERLAARKLKKVQAEQDQKLIEEKLRLQQAENEFLDLLLASEAQTEGICFLCQVYECDTIYSLKIVWLNWFKGIVAA
jgi:hypothetical protein